MNLDELLAFKPQKKRSLAEDDVREDEKPPSSKRRGILAAGNGSVARNNSSRSATAHDDGPPLPLVGLGEGGGGGASGGGGGGAGVRGEFNGVSEEEKLRILQSLEEDEDDTGEAMDAGAVKRMLLSFEKKVLKNQEMRIKFPDMPEKFMESELELNDEIQTLHVIATVPEYYPILVETNTIQTLMGLLSHDNSDVAIAVIDLLQEMTDVDTVNESEEEAEKLIDAMLEEQFVALLVQNLERLDEKVKEDSDGVHNTLAIIENTCELKNTEIGKAAGEQGLLQWLLKRIRVRQYDANKLYASEILAILLQNNESNQRTLGEMDGIDVLLQSLAYYKRRDPSGVDEIEMMENLFDCLCSCLMFTLNRERFLKGEGLQLMILMLKEKKMSRRSALKVLNHAMCGHEGVDNCSKFIEVYGLRSLFPAFMKPPKKSKKADTSEFEHEEHVCSIIGSLFANAQTPALRERLVGKFVENDCEKVDRLMELHFKYLRRIRNVEEQISREKRMAVSVETEDTDEDLFLKRLDAGLFTLQQVDYIIAELWTSDMGLVNGRIDTLLNQHGDSLQTVQETVYEFATGLGEGADPSSSDAIAKQKERLTTLASKL